MDTIQEDGELGTTVSIAKMVLHLEPRMKDRALQMNTGQEIEWIKHQEQTNTVTFHVDEQQKTAVPNTPSTSFTPSVISTAEIHSPPIPLSPTHSDERELRRLKRYSAAEEKLATVLRGCNSEPSPQELQIRALEKATLILTAHAQDAHERAMKLKTILANREMDPVEYESLKRERWMEEKRHSAVDQEAKVVLQHLDTLTRPPQCGMSKGVEHAPPPPNMEFRRQTNLIKFLESSQTRKPGHTQVPTLSYAENSTRQRTMDKVLPMRLRATSVTSKFVEPAQQRLRSMSVDGHKPPRLNSIFQSRAQQAQASSISSRFLDAVTEETVHGVNEDRPSTRASSSTLLTEVYSPTTTTISEAPFEAKALTISKHTVEADSETGTVTIYNTVSHHTLDPLSNDLNVSIPDYALDLLTQFEVDRTFSLQPSFSPVVPSIATRASPNPSLTTPLHRTRPKHSSGSPQVPSVAIPKPPERKLGRSSSYRQLGSLFSIPEALSSRLGVEKSAPACDDTAVGSPAVPHIPSVEAARPSEDVAAKVKKRFSALWL